MILNPEAIIVGGEITTFSCTEDLFLKPIIKNIENSLPFKKPEIKLSVLGEDATLIGTMLFATESLLVNEFPYKIENIVNWKIILFFLNK